MRIPQPDPKMAEYEEIVKLFASIDFGFTYYDCIARSEAFVCWFSPDKLLTNLSAIAAAKERDLRVDLTWLSALFVHRGCNIPKIMETSPKATVDKLTQLRAIYNIGVTSETSTNPTLARIATIMAPSAVLYLHETDGVKTVFTEMNLPEMPRGFKTNLCGSLIPSIKNFEKKADFQKLVRLHLFLMVLFRRKIKPSWPGCQENNVTLSVCNEYFKKQHTCDFFTDDKRIEVARKIGIVDGEGSSISLTGKMINAYEAVISQNPEVGDFDIDVSFFEEKVKEKEYESDD